MSKIATEEIVAVEFINHERNIINFVRDENKFGFFYFDPNTLRPRIGDLLKVEFGKTKDNKLYQTMSVQPAGPTDTCPAVKSFQGEISFTNKNGFGFVDDVFIYPQMVKKFNLENGQTVVGKAIYSFDKKKATWGWKVFKLIV